MENKKNNLEKLRAEYQSCARCQALCEKRTNVVFGEGSEETKLMLIGEAPGRFEDESGRPFVGSGGKYLTKCLNEAGLKREEVFITSLLLCRPPNNRVPTETEIQNCSERLKKTIEIIHPNVIVTMGNSATQTFLQTEIGISDLRGKIQKKDFYKAIPTWHPSSILYSGHNPQKIRELVDDLKLAKKESEK